AREVDVRRDEAAHGASVALGRLTEQRLERHAAVAARGGIAVAAGMPGRAAPPREEIAERALERRPEQLRAQQETLIELLRDVAHEARRRRTARLRERPFDLGDRPLPVEQREHRQELLGEEDRRGQEAER